jgi:IS5 family transposase
VVSELDRLRAQEAEAQAELDAAGAALRAAGEACAAWIQRNGPFDFSALQPPIERRQFDRAQEAERKLIPAYEAAHRSRTAYEQQLAEAMARRESAAT